MTSSDNATLVRVLVADRHRTVGEALALGLRRAGLAAEPATGSEEARRIAASRVDVALLDVGLLAEDLPAGLRDWVGRADVPVVLLGDDEQVGQDDPSLLCAAVRAGVRGWVPRSCPLPELLVVLDGVRRGDTWIPPRLLTAVLRELSRARGELDEGARLAAALTPRELEVLGFLCAGLTRCAIAEQLFVSPRTVRTHVQNILAKLDVHSSLAAVALARRAGLAP
ncbi:response regulator transcription factor [Streptacidiphilus jiangxiensis]|uniref:DNA-binding response regulator, NarL/FixJ family, contains REC and HTH domains n=1 Tax=Streptacidiphilus jiangxiensis TaxID=235985 RepID=A0A1H7QP94_STRJI|nr:response regulator transcription factor [Streptacidiphilus jiangxiensis]SEL49821.1 DNA-binding response regulator, NarL/FixJ family, contains REC and HTH domains [Streptacidiphilus jiangxiensis]